MLQRYAGSPWAISLAQRHLKKFLGVIGDANTARIFKCTPAELIDIVPRIAADVRLADHSGSNGGKEFTASRGTGQFASGQRKTFLELAEAQVIAASRDVE
jgi:hypothetical protein